ncbi:MAG: radical SAM protein [Brevefilum sp.]|nr:radical SAM protein [Brevefilum sp.]
MFKSKQPLLSHLDIELTERCNNACMHCYINLPERDTNAQGRELGTDQWKAILTQAADLGALSVRFTGGEPLLRDDFAELYLYTRRLGMKVVLFTNARLMTPELADLFARFPPLMEIEVSVYGMHADSYDAIAYAPGAFAEFRRGLNLLLERQIPFGLKSVLLPPNQHERDEYESWIRTLPGNMKPSYSLLLDFRTRRDNPAKNRIIERLRLKPEDSLALLTRHEADYCRAMTQFSEKFLYPQGDELFNCGAGHNGCVDAYGQYQMCMLLRHPDMVYDLSNGTLKEALTETFPNFRQKKASNPAYLQRCARCFLKGLCEQCPAKSWAEYGTLDTPVEYLCQIAHLQGRYLGLIEEGEMAWEVNDWQKRIQTFVHKMEMQASTEISQADLSGVKP